MYENELFVFVKWLELKKEGDLSYEKNVSRIVYSCCVKHLWTINIRCMPVPNQPVPLSNLPTLLRTMLDCAMVENYLCKIGLNECQKNEARIAIEQFKCDTNCLRANGCNCESKCDCRAYRKALRNLDCRMKKIITACQKTDYKCVKNEIKDQVKMLSQMFNQSVLSLQMCLQVKIKHI